MRRNENGEVNVLLIVVVLVSLIAVGFAGAFIWAFGERDNYKNNTESIVATAVEEARIDQTKIEEERFLEEQKKPNIEFSAPSDFGSVKFNYPRTWASYNVDNSSSKHSVYFYPKMVPNTSNRDAAFALRMVVETKTYEATLKSFESSASKGDITITPITTGKDENLKGMRVDGKIDKDRTGSIVVFKISDNKALTLRTDGENFMGDFNNTILQTLQFQQ